MHIINHHVDFYSSNDRHAPATQDWKQQPELPSVAEVLRPQTELEPLPKNKIDAPWASKEAYLEATYKILRREGVEGLRYSVNYFKADPTRGDDQHTSIYTKVTATGHILCWDQNYLANVCFD